jgi:glycosyltransferase involved in cell wall biosynthesis
MLGDGCGEIIPCKDAEALRGAILRLSDVSVRREIGTAALQRVRDEYTERAVLERLCKIYLGN